MRAQAQFTVHTLNDVVTSKTAPENPYVGQLWVKTSVSPPTTMVWNGSAWKEANGTEEIRTSISTLTTKEATLERNLNGLTSRVSLVETTVETVESDTAEAKQNILNLQSTVSEVSQTASDLSVRVTKNETDISSLSVSVSGIATRVSTAEGNISSVKQSVSSLTTRIGSAEGNISSLKQTATELSGEIEKKADAEGGNTSSFGWKITADGLYLYCNGKTVLSVNQTGVSLLGCITATSGSIEEISVSKKLYLGDGREYYISPNYNDSDYYIYLPGFRVNDASGAVFSGSLSAPSGTIGGFTITSTAIYKTKTSYSSSTAGVYIGTDGIGLGAGTFFVSSYGSLTAKSGTVGGFTIGSSYVYKTKTSYSSSVAGVYLGTDGIGLGAGTFYVTAAGALTATNATVTGSISATSGTLKEMTVTGKLYFGDNKTYYISPNYNNGSWYLYFKNFKVDDTNCYFSGSLNAPSGTIGGFTVSTAAIYKTKTSYSSSTAGVYVGTDGIGLGAGTFYVTSAGKVHASDVEITGGSMVLGSLASNFYNKIDSTGIQVGGYDWYSIRLAYGSLYLSADQWMDNDPSTIKLGFYGGGDTGVSIFGMQVLLSSTETFNISVSDRTTELYAVGMTMQAGKSYSATYGRLNGTWKSSSAITVTSDRNAKQDIEDLTDKYGLLFDRLTARRFRYKDGTSDRYHTGFVAQEVKESMTAVNLPSSEFAALCISDPNTDKESWGLRYEEFIAMNTWQIQKLKAEIKMLKEQLKEDCNET